MKKNQLKKNIFIILLIFGSLVGCAKDQTLEDYNRNQVQVDLGQLKVVEGQYTGYVTSRQDGSTLGALRLSLKATIQSKSSGEGKALAQPILVANIEFEGVDSIQTQVSDSYFDPKTGQLEVDIAITPANPNATAAVPSQPITVSLTGVIQKSQINGSIEAVGYGEYGGTFSLVSAAAMPTPQQLKSIVSGSIFSQVNYTGKTLFSSKAIRNVNIIVEKPKTTPEQDLLNLFVPVKAVVLTLSYGDGAAIPFQSGVWDQRTGSLTGQATFGKVILIGQAPQSVGMSITCKSPGNIKHLDCSVITNMSSGPVATMSVDAKLGAVVANPNATQVTNVYEGTAVGTTGGVPWTDKVKLNATYLGQSRVDAITDLFFPQAERNLQVSLQFATGTQNPNFVNSVWDLQNHSVSGVEQLNVGTVPVTFTLLCSGFTNKSPTLGYNFSCNFVSGMQNDNVNLTFVK